MKIIKMEYAHYEKIMGTPLAVRIYQTCTLLYPRHETDHSHQQADRFLAYTHKYISVLYHKIHH